MSSERSGGWLSTQVLDSLDRELVGLAPVKTRVREIAALLLVDRVRARFGLAAEPPSLHMCFTGNPGTGKTTVALRMAELLHRLGYLRTGHVVSVTRDDLVGQYVGHTAPKTKDVLKRAMGGVLFIDEAYYLYRAENERDYGAESIEILLQDMENHRDDLVVILAGYADRMETFFASNPGMSSRIAHHLEFPDYTLDELVAIGDLMLRPAAVPAVGGGGRECSASTWPGAWPSPGSRTRAASATRWSAPASGTPTGWSPPPARSARTTSCGSSRPTSSPAGYSAPEQPGEPCSSACPPAAQIPPALA